jgi:hypothetical protein
MASTPSGPFPEPLRAVVTIPHKPRDVLELEIKRGQRLLLVEQKGDWWYIARIIQNGKEGWVPAKHLRILEPSKLVNLPKLFIEWWEQKEAAFGNQHLAVPAPSKSKADNKGKPAHREKLTKDTFPFPPFEITFCKLIPCQSRKIERGLGVCVHEVERFLKAGLGEDLYGAKWLWGESLHWHPDRIGRKCKDGWKKDGEKAAGEMFVILSELIQVEREREGKKGL